MIKVFSLIGLLLSFFACFAQNRYSYSFIVAGHAYGAHDGGNVGLHPPFLKKLSQETDSSIQFLVLTGDIVNYSTTESWQRVRYELNELNVESFYVMGNHGENAAGYDAFNEKHGGTFYNFKFNNELFIVLNSTISGRSISEDQIEFLDSIMSQNKSSRAFIFFHEILWNTIDKYQNVLSNSRSRFVNIHAISNYWTEVHPILSSANCEVYVIAGDVAGNPDAIPAFYDKWDNVSLIASGMGEVDEENYLKVIVDADSVNFELIALNNNVDMKPIEYYSVPHKPDSIFGPLKVNAGKNDVEYYASHVFNATDYDWQITNQMWATYNENSARVSFDTNFGGGEIKVRSVNNGFGSSDWTSIFVTSDFQNNLYHFQPESLKVVNFEGYIQLMIPDFFNSPFSIEVFDVLGKIEMKTRIPAGVLDFEIKKSEIGYGIHIIRISESNSFISFKIEIE